MWLVWIALSVAEAVPGSAPGTLATGVISGLGAALLMFLGQWLLRRQQRDQLIAEAADQVSEAATRMLAEQRTSLIEARQEIVALRERIAKLESQLQASQADVGRIEKERQKALRRLEATQQRVTDLERQLKHLESVTERRKAP